MERQFTVKRMESGLKSVVALESLVGILPVYLDEDHLYAELSNFNRKEAEKLIELSCQFFQINGNRINQKAAELSLRAIEDFRAEATALNDGTVTNYITAIQFLYAIRNNTFCFYYRPLLLNRSGGPYKGQGDVWISRYNVIANTDIYAFNGTTFIKLTGPQKTVAQNEIANYKSANGIRIKHYWYDTNYMAHNNIQDDTGDVTSVIMPFQTFKYFSLANEGRDIIFLWSKVKESIHPDDTNQIKHDIVFSGDDINSNNGNIILPAAGGRFSNLSHLCPPDYSTADLVFPVFN